MLISMKSRGFTIVELIIVIAIMGILMTLGVVRLSSSQLEARDKERKSDVETLALFLESYYTSGNGTVINPGEYPSVDPTEGFIGGEVETLLDIDKKILYAPGDSVSSLKAATNNIQTTTGVLPLPSITDQYIYQPIASDGTLCDTEIKECVKFNLYTWYEYDNSAYMITSKNQ